MANNVPASLATKINLPLTARAVRTGPSAGNRQRSAGAVAGAEPGICPVRAASPRNSSTSWAGSEDGDATIGVTEGAEAGERDTGWLAGDVVQPMTTRLATRANVDGCDFEAFTIRRTPAAYGSVGPISTTAEPAT